MNAKKNHPILSVQNLTVTLSNEVIIENLNFEINRGEYFTIIGPNGAGKTTLFRALIGIIPYNGIIEWAPDVRIGYVPQKLDIERNVPLSLKDFLDSKAHAQSRNALERCIAIVGLHPALLWRQLGSLSGGEFQRALVAFALIGDTNVLLFDEPTVGIDAPSEEQIYETLHRLQDEKEITILTISHDLSLVDRYADKVLCVNKRKSCFGVPEEILRTDTLVSVYGPEHRKFFHHIHGDH